MSANTNVWKSVAVSAIIIAIVLGGSLAYAEVVATNLSNDKNNLQSNYNALKTTDDANVQKIDSLNSNIASLNSQISTLQAQQALDQATITHLQAELSANYTALQNLENANVVVVYFYKISPPVCILGICFIDGSGTLKDVAWANLGTTAAQNPQLTINFQDSGGNTLCSVVQQLGMTLPGGAIKGLTSDTGYTGPSCSTGSATATQVTSKVTWS